MSPRPKRFRKITSPPVISGFKPYGSKSAQHEMESVFLEYEEYEALKLCDYTMLNHHQAAMIMRVSRPTLTRIYARARQKVAEAMVLGKQIVIEGGKIYYDSEWFSCAGCGCFFNNPDKEFHIEYCPLCSSGRISIYTEAVTTDDDDDLLSEDVCVCPSCGHQIAHRPGVPCQKEECPHCHHPMARKGTPHESRTR